MYGWMCCNQWEKWAQWDDEDRRVAQDSMRSQIEALRPHAAAFIWANGSDGRPPPEVLGWYQRHPVRPALAERDRRHRLLGQPGRRRRTAVGRHPDGRPVQLAAAELLVRRTLRRHPRGVGRTGRQRAHPAVRQPEVVHPGRQAVADQRHLVLPRRLRRQQRATGQHPAPPSMRRYGSSKGAEEFTRKAQLAHYESTRAQFEAFAAGGWDTHKMTIYWMLNNHWPSFFGNLFDYYLRPGGAYYGAKKGLQPLSVVFDSYATGDHSKADITVVNQSADRPRRPAGPGTGLRPAGQTARRPGHRGRHRRRQRCEPGHDAAPGRTQLAGVLRTLRPDGLLRRRRGRQRLLAVPAAR